MVNRQHADNGRKNNAQISRRFNKSELKVHDVNDNPFVEANIIAIKEKI